MSRVTVILNTKARREQASRWCLNAPMNTRVEFKETKRTIPQNDRMHAMLTDVARQVPYHGVRLSKDDYKLLFLDGLKREMRLVPNLDGTGFVSLSGKSSSELSVSEMSDMIELIFKFGAEHGVVFGDDRAAAGDNLAAGVAA